MYNVNQICEKIQSISSDVGECGVDINVSFDGANKAWTVNMNKGNKKLKTFIEPVDVNECIDENKCLGLGLQIAQLKDNIKYM